MSDLNALDLEPGEIVGGYTLISRLGGGAMGSVWRVRDDGGQVYAMKILRDSLKDDSETGGGYQNGDTSAEDDSGSYGNSDGNSGNGSMGYDTTGGNAEQQHHHHSHDPHVTARERMRREAVAMRKINHPGVCAIVDMELDDSLAFIVTELIEGKNLRDDVAANGRYVGDDLQRLAAKLIDAVRAVHAQGIIHRDIKPTNVMVSAAGPVLVDFGIAMSAGESHVTRTGLVMGTPGFIAPEIIDGAESNEATDWWSLASVIAFAATGRPVFGSKPMMAVLEREASGNANLSGLPSNTLNALRSALDPDPTKRCSPDQLLQAITLDALNPFENGELDDEDDNDNINGPANGFGSTNNMNGYGTNANNGAGNSGNSHDNPEGVVPPFGQTPRPDSNSPGKTSDNPRASWTDSAPVFPNSPQASATATMPLSAPMTQSLEQTSRLPASNLQTAQQPDDATMPLTVAPTPQFAGQQQAQGAAYGAPYPAPYIYGQPNVQPDYPPQQAQLAQPVAQPAANPADIRRGKLLSRSILPLWLLTIPFALLSASEPIVSICCAAALLWFLLTLGYSEEGQLEREGRRGGIRKGGDPALRVVGLPWHTLKALIFTIPRALIFVVIAGVGPVVVNLVSGLPTHMITPSFGSWHLPLPLPADFSLSYSSLSLAIFMAAAWLVAVFGPKTTLLRIGAGRLRGAAYPEPDAAVYSANPAGNGYEDDSSNADIADDIDNIDETYDDADDEDDMANTKSKRHSLRRWVLLAIWLIAALAALALALTDHQINWIPLPNPQL
ncbi:protein kinase [Bifidobacterium sp. ESL0690]|uniref:serine/threonine-protein kinase n=1 Tax=Bifidobacterium sp. ESL0690 TaxID=2983214 RepID=UPI0023F9B10D|nr:protein kinase [Bifidobacterium sp. ESL0690]WEV46809.1 protein kinase [Bifidobacterium sp. ESL0690]